MNTLIKLIGPTLSVDFCYQNPQQYANALFSGASAEFQSEIGNSFFNAGNGTPDPDFRIYPWLRTGIGLAPRWYFYDSNSGLWISEYRSPPGPNGERMAWFDTLAALETYDEGVAGAITATTGPFWVQDTQFSAMFPLSIGTLASGAVIAPGTLGGTEDNTHTITADEMPTHNHNVAVDGNGDTVDQEAGRFSAPGEMDWSSALEDKVGQTRDAGGSTPMILSNMPPYFGMVWAKRTARAYYTLPP